MSTISTRTHRGKESGSKEGNSRGERLLSTAWTRLPLQGHFQPGQDTLYSPVISFSSVTQSCLTFCNPMDCSMPIFPVLHQLPELAQTHVH